MPLYPEQQKQALNKPSLLRRLFGEPLSEKTASEWPELANSWTGRQIERPDLEGKVNSIRPMSIFSKWATGNNAYASTSPFGGIQLNRELIEREKQDIGDVLIHEMSHANEGPGGVYANQGRGYNPSQGENSAIATEALRKVRKGDINLRASR